MRRQTHVDTLTALALATLLLVLAALVVSTSAHAQAMPGASFQVVAPSGGGGGSCPGAACDAVYLRLDGTNQMSAPVVTNFAATLATPSLEPTGFNDACVANAAGSRGVCFSGSSSTSMTDGVIITGSAAASTSAVAVAIQAPVSAVTNRYVLDVDSSVVGVWRVDGTGGMQNGSAQNGSQITFNDSAGVRNLAGIWTSQVSTGGVAHDFDTTTTFGTGTLLRVRNLSTTRLELAASGALGVTNTIYPIGDTSTSFDLSTGVASVSAAATQASIWYVVGGRTRQEWPANIDLIAGNVDDGESQAAVFQMPRSVAATADLASQPMCDADSEGSTYYARDVGSGAGED